jgi:hypothetical protein
MKKICMTLLVTTLAYAAFAQEFTISGEVKTGLFWSEFKDGLNDPIEKSYFHSRDDAGDDYNGKTTLPVPGRFQVDMAYSNNNVGFKTRIRWERWAYDQNIPIFYYAFGYGNFFDDQLTISLGKLGSYGTSSTSPWGTGGPEMWKELEVSTVGGIRFEIKPWFIPGLNAGFVVNYFDSNRDQVASKEDTILDYLMESIIGVSYTHDLFHVRFAYRLDSDRDIRENGGGKTTTTNEGGELIYRVEEYVLQNYLPGFSIWALGYFVGVGAEAADFITFQNWLFTQYEPNNFVAQIRFGFDVRDTRYVFHVKPSFYWKFFDNLINVGASFWYGQDFGEGKIYKDSPYEYMEVEPKIQVNFIPGSYVALVYNYRTQYKLDNPDYQAKNMLPIHTRQWVNLRFCIKY